MRARRSAFLHCLGIVLATGACIDYNHARSKRTSGVPDNMTGGASAGGDTLGLGSELGGGGNSNTSDVPGSETGEASAGGNISGVGGELGSGSNSSTGGVGSEVSATGGGAAAGNGGATSAGSGAATTAGNGGYGGNSNCPLPMADSAGAGGAGGSSNVDMSAIALTPPMGWSSWNRFGGGISETIVKQIADAMVSSGMAAAGYEYVNIDDTWQVGRDTCGNILPDTSRFPNGIGPLADYVHARGLKLGLYSDRGTLTCMGRPGSYGYETRDAETYAAWGVDFLKYDNCNTLPERDAQNGREDFTKMRDALRATGRPIVYSICAWWFYSWMPSVGNLWRTATDIQDNFATNYHGVISLINKNGEDTSRFGNFNDTTATSAAYGPPGLAQYAGPGHWNDPDMLEVGNGGMTDVEYRTHFSMWAMMAAPLIAGNDLRHMDQPTKDILLNADVIAVDQDPLGVQGQPLSGTSLTLEVWSKQLTGTSTYAVVLFNRTEAAADISIVWSQLGMAATSASVRDLWTHTDLGSIPNQYTATVASHGVVMLRVVGNPP